MAELNKGQLTAENTASFPNNTVGYITPDLLRTFNQNMIDSLVDEQTYNADSASVSASISQLKGFSSSLDNTFATDAQLNYSSSVLQGNIDLKVSTSQTASMTVMSSSQAITASFLLGFVSSASFAQTASFLLGTISSASYAVNADSSSYAVTASFALNVPATASYALFAETSSFALTSSITQQVSTSISTQNLQHNVLFVDTTGPGLVQVDGGLRYNPNTNLLTTTASLALTASFAENVPSNFATTGSNTFIGNQIISGNLLVTGSNINLEVDPPALSVGVTNVKTILDATASGVVSSTDIYRTGAGPTGDLSGIRLQTLSGSDTTGDTLLSRIQTAVNRHTSTAMTGSTVNTIISSQWATGSGGTRVTYGSTITINAQSASSTITLNAGNGANLNAGGTASLQAGYVKIGGAQVHIIEITGSLSVSGSTKFTDKVNITGSLNVSSSQTGDAGNFINGGVTIVGDNFGSALSIVSGSVSVTTPQGSGSFYTNLPITSSNGRINGYFIAKNIIISGSGAGSPADTSGSLFVEGNSDIASISSSRGLSITGSAPTIVSGSLSGSLISNLGSVYTSSTNANFIVTLGSASMAFLISSSTTNPNTLYFVI